MHDIFRGIQASTLVEECGYTSNFVILKTEFPSISEPPLLDTMDPVLLKTVSKSPRLVFRYELWFRPGRGSGPGAQSEKALSSALAIAHPNLCLPMPS
jgi:hypothetical protein